MEFVSISPDGISTHYLEVDRYHCKLTNKPCVGVFQDGNTGGDLVNSETALDVQAKDTHLKPLFSQLSPVSFP